SITTSRHDLFAIRECGAREWREVVLRCKVNKEWDSTRRFRLVEHIAYGFAGKITRETQANILVRLLALQLNFDWTTCQSRKDTLYFTLQIRKGSMASFVCGTFSNQTIKSSLRMLRKVTRHELIGW